MIDKPRPSIPDDAYVNCPIVYLDHNVFARFLDERDSLKEAFRALLLKLREVGQVVVPFSTTHILEVTRITGPERDRHIQRHLEVIKEITGGTFIDFRDDIGHYTVRPRSPFETFATMTEVPNVNSMMKELLDLVPTSGIEQARNDLGLNPVDLNNLSPCEAESRINQALAAKHNEVLASPEARAAYLAQLGDLNPISVERIIALLPELSPQIDSPNMHVRAVMKSTIMELFGFCPDKLSKDRLTAHCDSSHEAIAQAVPYFISEERRLLRKLGGRKSEPTEGGTRAMTRAEFMKHCLELMVKDAGARHGDGHDW